MLAQSNTACECVKYYLTNYIEVRAIPADNVVMYFIWFALSMYASHAHRKENERKEKETHTCLCNMRAQAKANRSGACTNDRNGRKIAIFQNKITERCYMRNLQFSVCYSCNNSSPSHRASSSITTQQWRPLWRKVISHMRFTYIPLKMLLEQIFFFPIKFDKLTFYGQNTWFSLLESQRKEKLSGWQDQMR